MGLRFQQWLPIGLSGLLLVLVIANILLTLGNADRQREINSRQAVIQQTQQVDLPLYREIVQALADLARRGDGQITYMLAAQGIQLNAPQAQTTQSAGQAAPAAAPINQIDPNKAKVKPQAPITPLKP